jgi:hypothetical protein
MTNNNKSKSSLIHTDEHGEHWIFIDPKKGGGLRGSEISQEQMDELDPEKCYLNRVNAWSQEAVDRLDWLLSLSDYRMHDYDRKTFESIIVRRRNIQ